MKCFIRSESEVRGVLPAPRGSAPRGSAPLGPVHRAPRRSVWPLLPGGLLPGGLLRGARLPGDCFMFPPRFHVPCWPRSYYTGPCSPLPCSRSLASSALSVVAVSVTTLPPVPLVSDIPFPRLLAWEDGVREIC